MLIINELIGFLASPGAPGSRTAVLTTMSIMGLFFLVGQLREVPNPFACLRLLRQHGVEQSALHLRYVALVAWKEPVKPLIQPVATDTVSIHSSIIGRILVHTLDPED